MIYDLDRYAWCQFNCQVMPKSMLKMFTDQMH